MFSTVSGSLSNILLDWVFIFPCAMGMFGAVFATCLAPVIGIGVSCLHFVGGKCRFRAVKAPFRAEYAKGCFSLGFSSFVEQLSNAAVMLAFNAIVYGIAGNTGVAAYGVVANVALVVISVFTGVSQGTQPLMSRAQGEDRRADVRHLLLYAASAAVLIAVVVYAAVFFFAEPLAQVFNSENDPALLSTAAEGLRLYFIGMPFAGFNMAVCAVLRLYGPRAAFAGAVSSARLVAVTRARPSASQAAVGQRPAVARLPRRRTLTAVCCALCLKFYKGKRRGGTDRADGEKGEATGKAA